LAISINPERGINGKGPKRKGAETERGIKERGIKGRIIKEFGRIKYSPNRKVA
jgi:hypothetical protein